MPKGLQNNSWRSHISILGERNGSKERGYLCTWHHASMRAMRSPMTSLFTTSLLVLCWGAASDGGGPPNRLDLLCLRGGESRRTETSDRIGKRSAKTGSLRGDKGLKRAAKVRLLSFGSWSWCLLELRVRVWCGDRFSVLMS